MDRNEIKLKIKYVENGNKILNEYLKEKTTELEELNSETRKRVVKENTIRYIIQRLKDNREEELRLLDELSKYTK